MQEGYFGVLPVGKGQIGTLQKFGMGWSRNLKFVGAACNGLVMKGKNFVIGDALEKQLFQAVEAQYVVHAGFSLLLLTAAMFKAMCTDMWLLCDSCAQPNGSYT